MKKILSAKHFLTCLLIFLIWHIAGDEGSCQQNKETEVEETFFNLGYISYSASYVLSPDRLFITFKVKNNTSRPISNIFAWIYRTSKAKEGETPDFLLVNNPNKGGILLKGASHSPGETSEWRFPLIRAKEPVPQEEYSLRVSPKSIFFGDKLLK